MDFAFPPIAKSGMDGAPLWLWLVEREQQVKATKKTKCEGVAEAAPLFLKGRMMNAKFTEIHAAADYLGPGAVEVPMYQSEITDLVRRRGVFGQRIKQVPATGHPSRFFEETAIPSPAASSGFVDPRNIVAPLVTPTRVERSVPLKALVAQINYNLFDMELGQQQSQFAYLQAKDLADTVDGVLRTHDIALWNGTDTSLSSPTTAQYFGAAAQIASGGNTVTIGAAQSIIDGLK